MSVPVETNCKVDAAFLGRVLSPYRDNCRYLKSVDIRFEEGDSQLAEQSWQTMVARGSFAIDRSCYIDDTGHFNAVEFNICYNQLAYVHLAACVRDRLMPALDEFDLDSFYAKQLSNYLIHSIRSEYHTEINPRCFSGEVRVVSARRRGKLSILRTHCRFFDEQGGASDGEVKLAVISP
jgi:hypothetical protein